MSTSGNQFEYSKLLDAFGAKNKAYQECVYHLISLGYTYNQAKNAVHVYFKGGNPEATIRLPKEERDNLLDGIAASNKPPKECVNYLRSLGYAYHQATSAVYFYRKERGLIRGR